jgi:hypothetical protein
VFIGVSNQDTVADGKAYQQRFDVPYDLAHAPQVWELFGYPFRPTTIVIDQAGAIAGRIDGPVTLRSLEALIQRAL